MEADDRIAEYVATVDAVTRDDFATYDDYLFYSGRANAYRTDLQTWEWAGRMEPCGDSWCEAGRAFSVLGFYVGGELLTIGFAAAFRWAAATRPVPPPRPRLEQDVAVSPVPPRALPLARPIGLSPTQNAFVQSRIRDLLSRGATEVRVNQQQINLAGQRVGINRPDLQYTLNGQRYYEEFETLGSIRGPAHVDRLLANDPTGVATWQMVP